MTLLGLVCETIHASPSPLSTAEVHARVLWRFEPCPSFAAVASACASLRREGEVAGETEQSRGRSTTRWF